MQLTAASPSGAEMMFGDFAPELVELTDKVLFVDFWQRTKIPSATAVSRL